MGANAQTTVPTFTAAQVLTAAQMNQSARTGVPVFATTTDRDAAFGGTGEKTLAEGQLCYIEAAPDQYQVYDGTNWRPFQINSLAYTPTFTNLNVGNGGVYGQYIRLGQFVYFWGQCVFGSTTSITGTVYVNFPVTANGALPALNTGWVRAVDAGVFNYECTMTLNTTQRWEISAHNATGTYVYQQVVNASVPFSWGNGDFFMWTGVYEAG
jgi:hypothetical protein